MTNPKGGTAVDQGFTPELDAEINDWTNLHVEGADRKRAEFALTHPDLLDAMMAGAADPNFPADMEYRRKWCLANLPIIDALREGTMVAVPREPTEAMLLAGNRKLCDHIECSCDEDEIFRAMLSAATAGLSEDKT